MKRNQILLFTLSIMVMIMIYLPMNAQTRKPPPEGNGIIKSEYVIYDVSMELHKPYRYHFTNYSWADLDYDFIITFKGDSCLIMEYSKLTYRGLYLYDGEALQLANGDFYHIYIDTEQDSYVMRSDLYIKRVYMLHNGMEIWEYTDWD